MFKVKMRSVSGIEVSARKRKNVKASTRNRERNGVRVNVRS